jgi:PncC family amidohydrolase
MSEASRKLGERLLELALTISIAESCTAGGLAHEITRIPGASAYFLGGIIAYDNAVKTSLLEVPQSALDRFGAVSAETAEAMAVSCRRRFHSDIAVSITGVAGPGGGTPDKPVGLVFIAVAGQHDVQSLQENLQGSRDEVRAGAVDAALHLVLSFLARDTA